MRQRQGTVVMPPHAPSSELQLVRFASALARAASVDDVAAAFRADFGRITGMARYGFNVLGPSLNRPAHVVAVGVSDNFIARYVRDVMEVDPILAHALESGRPTYNMSLMSPDEWLESEVYRGAYRVHDFRHVAEVPMIGRNGPVGHLHFADPTRNFAAADLRLAEAIAQLIADALDRISAHGQLATDRERALSALTLAGTAVAIDDPGSFEPRLNDAARTLLADVVDAEARLHELLAPPVDGGVYRRRLEVELVGGGAAVLHGQTSRTQADGAVVTVLELQPEHATFSTAVLGALTPRESEIAVLVAEGLADREIAEHLMLSHHTVSQHVKRIYRKLSVDSRVGLTRLLLGARPAARRS